METYSGHVRTPADAIILFEACRLGLLPRVQRRLSEKERQSIKTGSVFVWDEREAGMRRWTDGKSWSASRVSGSFLTYREMEGKRGGGGNAFASPVTALVKPGKTPDNLRGSDSDMENGGDEGPDGYRYKPDGLMKQSFSITTSSGNHLHLISYYSRAHPSAQQLTNPTSDPQLRNIRPAKGMYPESTVHEHQSIPAVTRSPMASAPYSTVPQMAGYARQGPPQWSQHYTGYNWQQGLPPHQQRLQNHGYQYANGSHYVATPPSNGRSPLQYSQSAHPPHPQSLDPNIPPYDSRGPPPMPQPQGSYNPTYDSRGYYAQTPTENQSPSLPQPHHHDQAYANKPPEPAYNSRRYSGAGPPILRLPPQQNHHGATSANGEHSTQDQSRKPSPQIAAHPSYPSFPPQQPQPHSSHDLSNSSNLQIDPRLMAPSPLPQPQPQSLSNNDSRASTPAISRRESGTTSHANGASQANTIPSIGALMNGSSAENFGERNNSINGSNADARSDISGERSPGGTKSKDGPQDIPSDKVGFHEDMRALKVLDRAFKT